MQDLVPLLVAALLGGLIGFEREARHMPAGLRTHSLVSVGSALFIVLSTHAAEVVHGAGVDATRAIHGIATGVGFLGAGSILRREGLVHGLTTAATIWCAAATGAACGLGEYRIAGGSTALVLVILEALKWIERRLTPSTAEGVESAER